MLPIMRCGGKGSLQSGELGSTGLAFVGFLGAVLAGGKLVCASKPPARTKTRTKTKSNLSLASRMSIRRKEYTGISSCLSLLGLSAYLKPQRLEKFSGKCHYGFRKVDSFLLALVNR